MRNGQVLRVECKKGPLSLVSGSPEYPLLRSALGHLLTLEEVNKSDIIAVAVPRAARFRELRYDCIRRSLCIDDRRSRPFRGRESISHNRILKPTASHHRRAYRSRRAGAIDQ